ncbi:hypothetical protein V6N13_137974 [Hibiscus sabdariffa]
MLQSSMPIWAKYPGKPIGAWAYYYWGPMPNQKLAALYLYGTNGNLSKFHALLSFLGLDACSVSDLVSVVFLRSEGLIHVDGK